MKLLWNIGSLNSYNSISNVNVKEINLLKIVDNIDILELELPNNHGHKNQSNMTTNSKNKRKRDESTSHVSGNVKMEDNAIVKKQIVQYYDNINETPNAISVSQLAYSSNKMIMGIGIYSQYEFDINNNIYNKKVNIFKYFNKVDGQNDYDDKLTEFKSIGNVHEKPKVTKKCIKDTYITTKNSKLIQRDYILDIILNKRYNKCFTEIISSKLNSISLEASNSGPNKEVLNNKNHHGNDHSNNKQLPKTKFANNAVSANVERRETVLKNKITEMLRDGNKLHFRELCPTNSTNKSAAASTILHILNLATQGSIGIEVSNNNIIISSR